MIGSSSSLLYTLVYGLQRDCNLTETDTNERNNNTTIINTFIINKNNL